VFVKEVRQIPEIIWRLEIRGRMSEV